jgi:hypothetical protein
MAEIMRPRYCIVFAFGPETIRRRETAATLYRLTTMSRFLPIRRSACRAALFASLCLPSSLLAQQPAAKPAPAAAAKPEASESKPTTLSMDARLVNLPVVVRDKKGALIQNLTKADFTLQVDGKPQEIRSFDKDANLPLTLGLLVDTSMSQRTVLDDERTASAAFLEQMLTAKQDKAFVIQFAKQTELLEDLTDSKPKLQAALKDIDSAPASDSADRTDDEGRRIRGGGTVLYDATFLASDELMKKQKGRKAIILLTDGVDRNSKESLTSAIEAAQRADTTLYAIYFKGQERHDQNNNNGFPGRRGGGYPGGGYPGGGGGYPGGGGGYPGGGGGGRGGQQPGGGGGNRSNIDGKKVLERMCSETGGRVFEVTKKQTVGDIYQQIGEELRAQYRLGYTPDADHSAEGYHQIDLALKDTKAKMTVQTRDGYYTGGK